jgi:hypothetical protein
MVASAGAAATVRLAEEGRQRSGGDCAKLFHESDPLQIAANSRAAGVFQLAKLAKLKQIRPQFPELARKTARTSFGLAVKCLMSKLNILRYPDARLQNRETCHCF